MQVISIIFGYLRWHYGKSVYSLTRVWKNFLFFIYEFFSIRLLFKNFFDPWKRMTDAYPKSFNLKKYFFAFIANIIVRIVGVIMRTFLLIVGLTCYILFTLIYPIAIIIWLILPLIIIIMFSISLSLIFS